MPSLPDGSILDRLREHARRWPNRLIYQFLHEERTDTYTFGELEQRVRCLASRLLERASPGDRALLLYQPGLEFIEAFLSCLAAGIVAVPAPPPRRNRHQDRVQAIVQDARPRLALTTQQALAGLKTCGLPETLDWIATDDGLDATPLPLLPHVDASAVAFLQYTSGSTTAPRGVIITHANICANARQAERAFQLVSWDNPAGPTVGVSWLPMFHDMGLIGSVLQPLYIGFRALLLAPTAFLHQPARWLDAISQHRAIISGAPNFAYELCVRQVTDTQKRTLDLSCWAVAFNGAEPIRASTLDRFAAAFARCGFRPNAFAPCYGLAEATLLVSSSPPGRGPFRACVSNAALESGQVVQVAAEDSAARLVVGSGQTVEGIEVILVDPNTGQPCGPECVGEVWLRSAGVGQGYWDRPEETEHVFHARLANRGEGPFLRTGDLGFLLQDELFITSRLKDLIILRGRNLYPQDIEEVVEQAVLSSSVQSAAFAVDSTSGEELVVVVEIQREALRAIRKSDHADSEFTKLISGIREAVIQAFEVGPHRIAIVGPGGLPRTSSGKVQRGLCRTQWLAGSLDVLFTWQVAPVPTPPEEQVVPVVQQSQRSAPSRADAETSQVTSDRMIGWFRAFAETRLNSQLADERRSLSPAIVLELSNQGFFGLQVPLDLGGRGLLVADTSRILEQLAAVDLSLGVMVGNHNGIGLLPILRYAALEERAQLVPPLSAGRQLAAFALTEPMAGSNVNALRTVAHREGAGWRLHGQKRWIGMASWASWITVVARAVDASDKSLGLMTFLVESDSPGLRLGPESLTMGVRATVQNRLFLDGVWVPDAKVLGGVGEGMRIAQEAMNFSRLGIAALSLGVMKRAAQLWVRYASRRTVATGRLLDSPITLGRLTDLIGAISAVESLVARMTQRLDSGGDLPLELYAACKATAPELAFQAVDWLLQGLGGRGYEETSGVPRLFRDTRLLRIFEGPTETMLLALGAAGLQREGTARRLLDEPFSDRQLADEVAGVLREIQRRQPSETASFDAMQHGQFLCYQAGELLASAILLAAARGHRTSEATTWAVERYTRAVQAVRASSHSAAVYSGNQLASLVAGYAAAIGDVEPTLPGEETDLDPLLLRDTAAPVTTPPEDAPRNDSMLRLVHDIVLARLQEQGIVSDDTPLDHDMSFSALGLDSLLLMRIGLDVQNATGQVLSPELAYEFSSIRELARYLERSRTLPL